MTTPRVEGQLSVGMELLPRAFADVDPTNTTIVDQYESIEIDGITSIVEQANGIVIKQLIEPTVEYTAEREAFRLSVIANMPVPVEEKISAAADALEAGDLKTAAALLRASTRDAFTETAALASAQLARSGVLS